MNRNQGDQGATVYSVKQLITLFNNEGEGRKEVYPTYYETGLKALDNKIYGLHTGNVIVIASPPAMGKRPLALSIISQLKNYNGEDNPPIRYFSLELGAQSIFKYLLKSSSKKSLNQIDKELISSNSNAMNFPIFGELSLKKIIVDDERFADFTDLVRRIRHDQLTHKSKIFVIDYLQLLGNCKDSKREVNLCLKELKTVAEELNVLVIILSRISRKIEKRKKRKPKLSDLLSLGDFDCYADYIFLLYRPEYYGIITDKKGRSNSGKLYIFGWNIKKREQSKVRLRFIGEYKKVENWN